MVPSVSIRVIRQLVRNLNSCPCPPLNLGILNQKLTGQGLAICVLTSPLGYFDAHQLLRTTGLDRGETGNERQAEDSRSGILSVNKTPSDP